MSARPDHGKSDYRRRVLRLPLDVLVPGASIASASAGAGTRRAGGQVRVRVSGDRLLARRWVRGHFATGHAVGRARLEQSPAGLRILGRVAPSGLDLAILAAWAAATVGIVAIGFHADQPALALIALLPLAFGVGYASFLPRAVREGREVIERFLLAEL